MKKEGERIAVSEWNLAARTNRPRPIDAIVIGTPKTKSRVGPTAWIADSFVIVAREDDELPEFYLDSSEDPVMWVCEGVEGDRTYIRKLDWREDRLMSEIFSSEDREI